jgi:hypothetical protein
MSQQQQQHQQQQHHHQEHKQINRLKQRADRPLQSRVDSIRDRKRIDRHNKLQSSYRTRTTERISMLDLNYKKPQRINMSELSKPPQKPRIINFEPPDHLVHLSYRSSSRRTRFNMMFQSKKLSSDLDIARQRLDHILSKVRDGDISRLESKEVETLKRERDRLNRVILRSKEEQPAMPLNMSSFFAVNISEVDKDTIEYAQLLDNLLNVDISVEERVESVKKLNRINFAGALYSDFADVDKAEQRRQTAILMEKFLESPEGQSWLRGTVDAIFTMDNLATVARFGASTAIALGLGPGVAAAITSTALFGAVSFLSSWWGKKEETETSEIAKESAINVVQQSSVTILQNVLIPGMLATTGIDGTLATTLGVATRLGASKALDSATKAIDKMWNGSSEEAKSAPKKTIIVSEAEKFRLNLAASRKRFREAKTRQEQNDNLTKNRLVTSAKILAYTSATIGMAAYLYDPSIVGKTVESAVGEKNFKATMEYAQNSASSMMPDYINSTVGSEVSKQMKTVLGKNMKLLSDTWATQLFRSSYKNTRANVDELMKSQNINPLSEDEEIKKIRRQIEDEQARHWLIKKLSNAAANKYVATALSVAGEVTETVLLQTAIDGLQDAHPEQKVEASIANVVAESASALSSGVDAFEQNSVPPTLEQIHAQMQQNGNEINLNKSGISNPNGIIEAAMRAQLERDTILDENLNTVKNGFKQTLASAISERNYGEKLMPIDLAARLQSETDISQLDQAQTNGLIAEVFASPEYVASLAEADGEELEIEEARQASDMTERYDSVRETYLAEVESGDQTFSLNTFRERMAISTAKYVQEEMKEFEELEQDFVFVLDTSKLEQEQYNKDDFVQAYNNHVGGQLAAVERSMAAFDIRQDAASKYLGKSKAAVTLSDVEHVEAVLASDSYSASFAKLFRDTKVHNPLANASAQAHLAGSVHASSNNFNVLKKMAFSEASGQDSDLHEDVVDLFEAAEFSTDVLKASQLQISDSDFDQIVQNAGLTKESYEALQSETAQIGGLRNIVQASINQRAANSESDVQDMFSQLAEQTNNNFDQSVLSQLHAQATSLKSGTDQTVSQDDAVKMSMHLAFKQLQAQALLDQPDSSQEIIDEMISDTTFGLGHVFFDLAAS